ncbi:antitermination protein [Serratia ficaria]|uniref:antitermination protein n=1 Tax=Serratia ficaria TaxID=61651 RepID=UPI002182D4BC|nr:antitermination protein [Serratia ficaria]CAI2535575.1 Antitermination protein [Serratia ficaria]
MRIEHALLASSPKSPSVMGMAPDTKPQSDVLVDEDGVTHGRRVVRASQCRGGGKGGYTDVMVALGITQSREAQGLSLLYAKFNKDTSEREKAIERLAQFAIKQAPKLVGKAAGRQMARCMVLLSKLAVEDYCRTADIVRARCRCGGSGKVYDIAATKAGGKAVEKTCSRCHGTGLKPTTTAQAYKVVKGLIPDLSQPTWNRNWQRFYQMLISKCYQDAESAEMVLGKVTSNSQD